MQSSTETIKNLLKRYVHYKIQAENGLGGKVLQRKLKFIEKAISVLNEQDFKLINLLYQDGLNISNVAKLYDCTRQTIYNRCEKIVKMIAEVYEDHIKT